MSPAPTAAQHPAPSASRHAVFPGSFDPVTLGHLDVIVRAARLFEHLTVAVAQHPSKRELLPLERRVDLLRSATAHLPNVSVAVLGGLVVEGCRQLGASIIVRGIRNALDFEYEAQMARSNQAMAPQVDTVFIASDADHVHISSTLVRQVAELGGPLELFVPPAVAASLREVCAAAR
jgi:pantetheine-phosphate adenylyltransferase